MSKVTVKLYPKALKQLEQASQEAFWLTVEAVLTDIITSQTTPKDTGELERSGFTKVDLEKMVAYIIFDTPYARKMYWHPEYDFRTDKNPNAGGLWMHPYIDGNKKKFVKETYSTFLKKLSGGLIK